jgi:predicted XRE-type DNA-binding protein
MTSPYDIRDLIEAMRKYINRNGLTQKEMGERINIDRARVSKLLAYTSKPNAKEIPKLIEFFEKEKLQGLPHGK